MCIKYWNLTTIPWQALRNKCILNYLYASLCESLNINSTVSFYLGLEPCTTMTAAATIVLEYTTEGNPFSIIQTYVESGMYKSYFHLIYIHKSNNTQDTTLSHCHLLQRLLMFSYNGELCVMLNGHWIMSELVVMHYYITYNLIFKLVIALYLH